MPKQASVQETFGTTGQSRVTAQFERMNWGVAPNPYHDLGTDLWLMARDDRRFDLGLLVGVQVKTSESKSEKSKYFKEPKREGGKVIGWWYRESSRDDHFDYWIKHAIPHLVVLHDLKSGKSYWVHVTKDAIIRTKAGTKILVPKNQQINGSNVQRLLDVAVSQRGTKSTWEGSSWTDIAALGPEDRVRYALLTPRLMAKRHQPRVGNDENPPEAIAMLVQHRLMELDGSRDLAEHLPGIDPPPFLSAQEALASDDGEWNLYGALHSYVHNGDPDVFTPLVNAAKPGTAQHAAATVIGAATLIESGRIREALTLTAGALSSATSLDPVNFAWIEVQQARCLLELGKYKKARELAIHVQRIQAAAADDPTAMAIAASAAGILLRASNWSVTSSNFLSGNDTAAGWWRNQTIATGLEMFLDDRFALWASESAESPKHLGDTWRQLRTATLLSGFAGDHGAWRTEYSQLAQYVFQAHPAGSLSVEACAGLLTDLRLAGDVDSIKRCVQRLLMGGPEEAVRTACASVDLRKSTHSTARSDLELIAAGVQVLDEDRIDNFIRECVEILVDQRRYAKRVRPTFLVHHYVLQTLEALVGSASATAEARRVFVDYFLTLPAIEDQSLAHSLARVLKAAPKNAWTASDFAALAKREDDNWELKDSILGITAAADDDAREILLTHLRNGQTRMLSNIRDIRTIPQDVAEKQVEALSDSVRREVEEAVAGTFYRRDSRSLAMLNIWFPEVANWSPIYDMMSEFRVMPSSLISLATLIRDASEHIGQQIRNELVPRMECIRDRSPIDFGEWLEANGRLRTAMREALDALSPGAVSDRELWNLVGGSNDDRCAAARIVGRRRDVSRIDVLACLSYDAASVVRASSAYWIARWLEIGEVADRCNLLLEDLSRASGKLIAAAIKGGLTEQGRAAAGNWVEVLHEAADVSDE